MSKLAAWSPVMLAGLTAGETEVRPAGSLSRAAQPRWRGGSFPCGPKSAFARLAKRPLLAAVLVALLPLLLRALLLPVLPVPQPGISDEFGHLLAADTFAHGRFTNPTPPFWEHFESQNINFRPSYMSMFPPGQGLLLALGELLGQPWLGVWFSVGLMCGAVCWMMQGWLPPRWALLGGILVALTIGIFGYWMNSYWGGAVAAWGGALVLGALPRLIKQQKLRHTLLLAAGIAILANTRPYEGFVLAITVAAILLIWICRGGRPRRKRIVARIVVPLAVSLAVLFLAMGYYFWRNTGSPWEMPYVLNRQTYAITPHFVWGSLSTARHQYQNPIMKRYFLQWEPYNFELHKGHFVHFTAWKAVTYWVFFGPLFTLPLLMLPWVLRDRRMRPLLIIAGVGLLAVLVEAWALPHYVSPFTCLVYVLAMQGMRHLRFWGSRRGSVGKLLCQAVVAGCVLIACIQTGAAVGGVRVDQFLTMGGNQARAKIVRQLQAMPGKQLVLVRYEPSHDPTDEWVYNSADIPHAKVVWAHALEPNSDAEFVRYFKDRRAWTLNPDALHPEIKAYQPPAAAVPSETGPTAGAARTHGSRPLNAVQ